MELQNSYGLVTSKPVITSQCDPLLMRVVMVVKQTHSAAPCLEVLQTPLLK